MINKSISDSSALFLALSLLLDCLVQLRSDKFLFYFIMFYFVVFYYYLLGVSYFPILETRMGWIWMGREMRETGGNGGEAAIRVYYVRKMIYFQ